MKNNGDKIRAMNNEELAQLINSDWCEILCGQCPKYYDDSLGPDYCEKRTLEFLEEENGI